MKKYKKIKIYQGDYRKDKRGIVRFVNGFTFKRIKRFYEIENRNTNIIRGFHGHMKEEKYVYVIYGKILLCVVHLDNSKSPSKKNKVHKFVLSAKNPQIVHIPARYANGVKMLEENSKVIFFSTSTLKQSEKDIFKYPFNYWGKEVWEV